MKEKITIIDNSFSSRCRFCISPILLIALITVQTSCKKLLEVPPPANSITENAVYTTDATAIAVLTGLYSSMNSVNISNPIQGNGGISLITGMSSDELTLYNGITDVVYQSFYKNALQAIISPVSGSQHWSPLYNFIFSCNAAIEGLNTSTTLTQSVKQQLLGEAKFMRAFFYFYLVNLFGDVPLALTTDPQINGLLGRVPRAQVYQKIIQDLKEAQEYLSSNYLKETLLATTTERVRPTKWAATALLARAYLYTEDYAKAEAEATAVINNTSLFSLSPLNNVFLKNSREAIWQLQPTEFDFNTTEARAFIIPATGPSTGELVGNPVHLSDWLLQSFELGDQRAVYGNWIDTTIFNVTSTLADTVAYPFKYKINTSLGVTSTAGLKEYFMILRLGEQYLIRAEARAHQSNIGGAQEDLNAIRIRAGLSPTTAGDKNSLLTAIFHERQVELFTELGHRWFDLKRTNKVDAVMNVVTPLKANGAPWQSYQQVYPLPLNDLQKASNLVQNTGY